MKAKVVHYMYIRKCGKHFSPLLFKFRTCDMLFAHASRMPKSIFRLMHRLLTTTGMILNRKPVTYHKIRLIFYGI